MRLMAKRKVRYAVVGQGHFAQVAVLPAFAHAKKNSELTALVSGDERKLKKLSKTYGVARTVGYDGFDELCASGDIDAVYLVVPNHKHREYTERAAKHGIHVLVEKPMAVTEEDCEAMTAACNNGGAKLMVGYRLHFEAANLRAIELVRRGKLGEPRIFHSAFTMQVAEHNVRLNPRQEGGGPLYDIGIYCINAARCIFGEEPLEVIGMAGRRDDPRFTGVEEQLVAALRFPGDRLASFSVGFGAAATGWYQIIGTKGSLRLDPAFEYRGERRQDVTIGDKTKRKKFAPCDQIAPEIAYFSDCILDGKEPEPSGLEGLADVRIIRALYRSIDEGHPVKLEPFDKPRRPEKSQVKKKRAAKKEPETVNAPPETAPSS
jgi:predicted dehydrogenase